MHDRRDGVRVEAAGDQLFTGHCGERMDHEHADA